ncbi:MAG: SCO family protein [Betaproteobacteria bacterium]
MSARAAFAAALAPLVLGCAQPGERRADAGRLMSELMSGRHAIGGEFALVDVDGKVVRLADFRGKLVLVYFGFATCPDVCPTDLAYIGQALHALGEQANEVQPLFVTLDPWRDSPAILREYAAAFHPRLRALTGDEHDIRRVATAFKVFYEKVPLPDRNGYTIDHTAYTFLLDRQGRFLTLAPPGTGSERMIEMIAEHLGR